MKSNREIRELLQQGREEALTELAIASPRALRPLTGRLWDPDEDVRRLAAATLARCVVEHPKKGVETIRHLMWALNDESATNGVFAVPALAEVGRLAPELIAPFLPGLVAIAWDDGLRMPLIRALEATARSAPDLVRPHAERIRAFVDQSSAEERQAYRRLSDAVSGDPDHVH